MVGILVVACEILSCAFLVAVWDLAPLLGTEPGPCIECGVLATDHQEVP